MNEGFKRDASDGYRVETAQPSPLLNPKPGSPGICMSLSQSFPKRKLAFQAVLALNGFDLSKQVFRGPKTRVLGGWGVGGWSERSPSKSSDVGFLTDLFAPPPPPACLAGMSTRAAVCSVPTLPR